MKMNILIIDNHPESQYIFNIKEWLLDSFPGTRYEVISESVFDPNHVITFRPDIVILDVALLEEEEDYFDGVLDDSMKYDENSTISGIKYCLQLKANFTNLPVILMSHYFHPKILSSAIEAGADGFLYKENIQDDMFITAIKAAFFKCKTDDISFYECLRNLLEDEGAQAWKSQQMLNAMDAFFTRGSGTRRLTGLWCNLAGLIEPLLPTQTVNELLKALMDTEALLLSANPRMRDHVRHPKGILRGILLYRHCIAYDSPVGPLKLGFIPTMLLMLLCGITLVYLMKFRKFKK